MPSYLRSAYLWVFVFKRDRWPHHRYEIVGEEQILDRPAIRVRFEPIPPYRDGVNDWFGTAWVDGDTAQLLEVEAHRVEERGLRFPGRVELRNDSYDFMRGLKGFNRATRTIMRVRQVYSDYRFYGVEATPVLEPAAE